MFDCGLVSEPDFIESIIKTALLGGHTIVTPARLLNDTLSLRIWGVAAPKLLLRD
jgi:hypothetical protein